MKEQECKKQENKKQVKNVEFAKEISNNDCKKKQDKEKQC